jgi:hypothetical protein
MKKTSQEIIDKINEARTKEELAIPLYVSHIEQAFFWSGLDKERQKKIMTGLKILARESEKHAVILKKVLALETKTK